jgi:hypothetical protein
MLFNIILRAEKHGYTEYANDAKKRLVQVLKGGDYYLTINFLIAFNLYCKIQTQLKKRKYSAPRLSQMLKNHGIKETMIRLAKSKRYSQGFLTLSKYGFFHYTCESLICVYSMNFPKMVVRAAENKLERYRREHKGEIIRKSLPKYFDKII